MSSNNINIIVALLLALISVVSPPAYADTLASPQAYRACRESIERQCIGSEYKCKFSPTGERCIRVKCKAAPTIDPKSKAQIWVGGIAGYFGGHPTVIERDSDIELTASDYRAWRAQELPSKLGSTLHQCASREETEAIARAFKGNVRKRDSEPSPEESQTLIQEEDILVEDKRLGNDCIQLSVRDLDTKKGEAWIVFRNTCTEPQLVELLTDFQGNGIPRGRISMFTAAPSLPRVLFNGKPPPDLGFIPVSQEGAAFTMTGRSEGVALFTAPIKTKFYKITYRIGSCNYYSSGGRYNYVFRDVWLDFQFACLNDLQLIR